MQITDVRLTMSNPKADFENDRLCAIGSVTFDHCFVVHDIKVISSTRTSGSHFVAMPARQRTDRCEKCKSKNHIRARYCNSCGIRLNENRSMIEGEEMLPMMYLDVAHPLNAETRNMIEAFVLDAFEREVNNLKDDAPCVSGCIV